MRRLAFLLPILGFLGLLAYFARPLIQGADPSLVASPLIDRPVPTFTLPALPDRDHGLATADLSGGVQLVNIFASWCIPCRAEAPALMDLSRTHHLRIRGIAYKDKPDATLAYLAELGDPYQSVGVDADGRVAIDWGVYGVPETYLIDGSGHIRLKHVGPLTPEDVRNEILPAIARLEAK